MRPRADERASRSDDLRSANRQSRALERTALPIGARERAPSRVFWTGAYFVASCGGVTIDVLRKYVQDQDSPSLDPAQNS